MVTLCWAAKGGSGTTVVAAALALTSQRPSLLVDLDGELPAVLGVPEPDRPGVAEWLASDTSADHLAELLIDIGPRTWLLPWRAGSHDGRPGGTDERGARWATLGDWLHDWSNQWGCDVTVDVGTRIPPEPLAARAARSLLVTRPCYLSLRRAVRSPVRPTGVILVDEPGHGLGQRDIEHALGVPVEAVVSLDPTVSRAVDAGLLAGRLPRVMIRALRQVAA
jgi:hypothetical protein